MTVHDVLEVDGLRSSSWSCWRAGATAVALRPLTERENERIAHPLVEALWGTQGGVVHRDVKPANIMLASEDPPYCRLRYRRLPDQGTALTGRGHPGRRRRRAGGWNDDNGAVRM